MSQQHKKRQNPGLRRSQAVSTFGPGAIVDLRYMSVMMGGQDFWPEESVEIHEPNLERLLHVQAFRMPAVSGKDDLPAIVFPEWLVCPKCYRLAPYRHFTQGESVRTDSKIRCPRCNVPVYPARLITACEHGHVGDFPWASWVHIRDEKQSGTPDLSVTDNLADSGQESADSRCKRPEIYLRAKGLSSALSDLILSCKTCGAVASLSGATVPEHLRFMRCKGQRLWLADQVECGANVYPLQRGASNVYFPIQASSISIPPWSDRLYARLDRHWGLLRSISSTDTLASVVQDVGFHTVLGLSVSEVVTAIQFRQQKESRTEVDLTEQDLRLMECQAIRRGTGMEDLDSEFLATPAEVPALLQGLISRVVLVERLREVRALRGFTRVSPPDPGQRLQVTVSQIARQPMNWLPGVEVRGEGVYLELDEEVLTAWAELAVVKSRARQLQYSYERMCTARKWQSARHITPRLLLIHSLAHLLIRQLGLDSGYSSAALRERLYAFSPDEAGVDHGIAGLLIYTSTPDSEGSLGGLVRQGLPERLQSTMLAALQEASWCSSDPLCIESEGQGRDALNLAACHSCLLVSETSCEEFNVFLDRALLIGTLEHPHLGFFSQLLV